MNFLIIFSILLLSVTFASGGVSVCIINGKPSHASVCIINGRSARSKEFPFHAGLQLKPAPGKNNLTFCGGAVISDSYILTAAQCLENIEEIQVILGDIRRTASSNSGRKTFTVNKENFIIHNRFRDTGMSNDIGLIKLPTPVKFDDYIQPIILPPWLPFYSMVQTTGWGYTTANGSLSDVLLYADFQIIENEQCIIYHKDLVQPTNVCGLPQNGETVCDGDIGGPMFHGYSDPKTLLGIISFGSANCDKHTPVVFTRIEKYMNWINENAKN